MKSYLTLTVDADSFMKISKQEIERNLVSKGKF